MHKQAIVKYGGPQRFRNSDIADTIRASRPDAVFSMIEHPQ